MLVALGGLTAPVTAAPADEVPPATIRVCRSSGGVDTVAFRDYVKEVLPREFGAENDGDGPSAYVLAGAVAVKAFAWYYVRHPYSGDCDLTDTTRHQKYDPADPYNPRTPDTDAAVDQTWEVRFGDASTGDIAFAQYCSGSCSAHRRFAAEKFLQQDDARLQSDAGWTWQQIIQQHYRGMPAVLTDVRDPFALTPVGPQPLPIEDGRAFTVTAAVDGVAPGDPRAGAQLYVRCTLDGSDATHLLATASVAQGDAGPEVVFAADRVRDCTETEVRLLLVLKVNATDVAAAGVRAWVPWQADAERPVDRVAETDQPVAGAIAVSASLFADAAEAEPATAQDALVPQSAPEVTPAPEARHARAVVLARSDRFADALSATGLAGPDAPILLTPGGADSPLASSVRAEIDRVLPPGGTVHLIGGPQAVSQAAEDELAQAGYDVRRHAGEDRIATSLAVADAVRAEFGPVGSAMLARAWGDGSAGWADAVTGGAFAAAMRHPVLLTRTEAVAPAVEAWLESPDNGVTETIVLGGPAAVTADAEAVIDTTVTRVAGPNRSATAVAVADQLWTREGAPPVVAAALVDAYDAGDWPWALSASVYSAALGAPQLATRYLVPRWSTGEWLDARDGLPVYVVGGTSVVAPRVDEAASAD